MNGIDGILTAADILHHMSGLPSMFGFILGVDKAPKDFREYGRGDDRLYEELVFELIRRGVMPDSDGREPWFLSYSHDDRVIDETLNIFEDSVKTIKK
jgi:glutamate-1-semialdehyde 2,1-aminomutase